MMAERPVHYADERAALRAGMDLGLTLIDTAEMYADGESEKLVGQAAADIRDEVFLVSKAYPRDASSQRLPLACEASLQRMGTDRLDLYLLHWRGSVPLAETIGVYARRYAPEFARMMTMEGVRPLDRTKKTSQHIPKGLVRPLASLPRRRQSPPTASHA